MDTDSDVNRTDRPHTVCLAAKGELSTLEQNPISANIDQDLSEEQTYREAIRGITSIMHWKHIPDVDTTTAEADDNPFVRPKQQPIRKISVTILTDGWLCKKLDKLNLTRVERYHSRSTQRPEGCIVTRSTP